MRARSSQANRRGSGRELIALIGVIAVALSFIGVYTATRGGDDDNSQLTAGIAATATGEIATPPQVGVATTTPVLDEGIATYQAMLTATPVYVAPKPTGTITIPTEEPLPPLPTGINTSPQPMFSPAVFRPTTEWQGQTSAGFMMVYAGIKRDQNTTEDGPGAVRVYVIPTDERGAQNGQITLLGDYLAPGDPGELTITGVDGDLVHVTAANGEQFAFNVATQLFEQ